MKKNNGVQEICDSPNARVRRSEKTCAVKSQCNPISQLLVIFRMLALHVLEHEVSSSLFFCRNMHVPRGINADRTSRFRFGTFRERSKAGLNGL